MIYASFRDAFASVMDPEFYPIEYLDHAIANGSIVMLATAKSAICIEVRVYPSGRKDVHGLVAVGNMEEVVNQLIPQAEEWGRNQGCIGAVIESREGWQKILHNHGYLTHQITIRKGL